jgi:hypothetical protein
MFQRENRRSFLFLQTAIDNETSLPVFYHIAQRPRGRSKNLAAFPVLFNATFQMTRDEPITWPMLPDRTNIEVEQGDAMAWGQGNQLRKIRRS